MNCKNCSNQLPNEAKFCNKCGVPVQLDLAQEAKTKVDIGRLKKSVMTAGNSVYAIGWVTILFNVGIYFWSILDKNFLEYGLPGPDLPGVFIIVVVSVVFIILGSRIKKLKDKKIKIYLQILLVISVLLLVWIIGTGGRVGLLLFLVIAYLASSISSFGKLMKIPEFASATSHPEYKLNKNGWIIFAIAAVILFFVSTGVDSVVKGVFVQNEIQTIQTSNNYSKQELVGQIVQSAKSQTTLPHEIDDVTRLVDIVAEPNAIRYEYILHDLEETNGLSDAGFRNLITPNLCKNKSIVDILEEGIDVQYSYKVIETQQTYFTAFTKGDCSPLTQP